MHANPQSGLIKAVILIVVALVALSYLGFDIKQVVESPQTQKNATYLKDISVMVWQKYLKEPALYVGKAFIEFIWTPIVEHAFKGKAASGGGYGLQLKV
ncbi:MAG TPA: hypothetical protein VJH55_00165 [Candidatus Paceibacterota bacterium]